MKPIFLFSLPRSGSTLLQRMLAGSPQIATASEPWILLPIMHPLRSARGVSEYGNWAHAQALTDYCSTLDGGRAAYLREGADMARRLYRRTAGSENAQYFLDKTPRYHLIIDEILEAFDDARCILLWRNPLAVTASMMQSWTQGRWKLHHFYIDLYQGLANLVNGVQRYGDRLLTLQFENLVSQPESEIQRICQYLEIDVDTRMWSDFDSVKLRGRLGDSTGIHEYDVVAPQVAGKWTRNFSNPLRRAWGRQYLDWIGAERLHLMGYDSAQLVRELSSAEGWFRQLPADLWRMPYAAARRRLMDWTLDRQWP